MHNVGLGLVVALALTAVLLVAAAQMPSDAAARIEVAVKQMQNNRCGGSLLRGLCSGHAGFSTDAPRNADGKAFRDLAAGFDGPNGGRGRVA
jgi:hypothetical protein